ncbi:unnamed protein product [Mucor hiemalis]
MAKGKKLFDSDSDDEKEYKPSSKKVMESSDESSEEELSSKKTTVKKTAVASGDKRKREDTGTRDAAGNQIFELSSKRRITVRAFSSGEPSVDIREIYKDKNTGEMRPGKSGICLPMTQWNKLKELLPEIEEAIAALPSKKK